ncbi:DUF3709 domain-containing protein [Erysipelothrix tonsillarum]
MYDKKYVCRFDYDHHCLNKLSKKIS